MLKAQPLAHAFAAASVVFYVILYILKLVAPPFFKLLLDSQFLGAPIASQVPDLNFANFLGALIVVACVWWVFGYLVAVFYNKLTEPTSSPK